MEVIPENYDDKTGVTNEKFLPGQIVFGKFKIIRTIGSGGMGQVFEVLEIQLQKSMALKILLSHVRDPAAAIRFQNEARNISRLIHPTIVQIYDFGVSDEGIAYMAIELIRGSTLTEFVSTEQLNLNELVSVMCDLCRGLDSAHRSGIVHRDLKPDNIIVVRNEKGELRGKLLDFGISKRVDLDDDEIHKLTLTGQLIGTPLYMSPEQCQGKTVDSRSDIYSLGCVMYFAIVGQPPFRGDAAFDTMRMHMEGDLPSLSETNFDPDVVNRLEEILHSLMAKEPTARPSLESLNTSLSNLVTSPIVEDTETEERSVVPASDVAPIQSKFASRIKFGVVLTIVTVVVFGALSVAFGNLLQLKDSVPAKVNTPGVVDWQTATVSEEDLAQGLDRRIVELSNKDLEDPELQKYKITSKIEFLDLKGNPQLTSNSLVYFKNNKGLKTLLLNHTGIKSLDFISSFPKLADLEVDSTAITDKNLESISENSSLKHLNLKWTLVTPVGIKLLSQRRLPDRSVSVSLKLDKKSQIRGFTPAQLDQLLKEKESVIDYTEFYGWQIQKVEQKRIAKHPAQADKELAELESQLKRSGDAVSSVMRDVLFYRSLCACDLLDFKKASTLLEQCISVNKQLEGTDIKDPYPTRVRSAMGTLIPVYLILRDPRSADLQREYEQSFDLYKPEEAKEFAIGQLRNGAVYFNVLNSPAAESCLEKALSASKDLGGRLDMIHNAAILELLARVQYSMHKDQKALKNYVGALELLCSEQGLKIAEGKGGGLSPASTNDYRQSTIDSYIGVIEILQKTKKSNRAKTYLSELDAYVKRFPTKRDYSALIAKLRTQLSDH